MLKIPAKVIAWSLKNDIEGLRLARKSNSENVFVSKLCQAIRDGLYSGDQDDAINATIRLIYLNIAGYDTRWADFAILEVMSQERYAGKRIGYLAASIMWDPTSDSVVMSTNRIKRDLSDGNELSTSLCLTSISPFMNAFLAKNVAQDVISLMNSTYVVVRQKAIISYYLICLQYPDALQLGLKPLANALADRAPGVVTAALTVINELCLHAASKFLSLIPSLLKLLQKRKNKHLLVRVLAILKLLSLEEPRLARKLLSPFQLRCRIWPQQWLFLNV